MTVENQKSDLVFIKHILESINAIEEFSKNLSKICLASSRLEQSAIVREIEIIGEAVKNISFKLKANNSNIPWKEIAGTRDNLIHHYFGVDLDIIWNIINNDLKDLKKKVKLIEKELISKT